MKILFKSSVIIPEACSAFGELILNSTHFEILCWSNNLVLIFLPEGGSLVWVIVDFVKNTGETEMSH